jgi:hypothetical protein
MPLVLGGCIYRDKASFQVNDHQQFEDIEIKSHRAHILRLRQGTRWKRIPSDVIEITPNMGGPILFCKRDTLNAEQWNIFRLVPLSPLHDFTLELRRDETLLIGFESFKVEVVASTWGLKATKVTIDDSDRNLSEEDIQKVAASLRNLPKRSNLDPADQRILNYHKLLSQYIINHGKTKLQGEEWIFAESEASSVHWLIAVAEKINQLNLPVEYTIR